MKNPKYIEIDGTYYSGLIIIDYSREYKDIVLKNLINANINMNISIFYERLDAYRTIKDLTYYIGNVGVDIKSGNENREDIDIASYTYILLLTFLYLAKIYTPGLFGNSESKEQIEKLFEEAQRNI